MGSLKIYILEGASPVKEGRLQHHIGDKTHREARRIITQCLWFTEP